MKKISKEVSGKKGEIINEDLICKLIYLYSQRPMNAEPVGAYNEQTNAMYIYQSAGTASKLTNEAQPSITRATQTGNKLNGKTWFKVFKENGNGTEV